MAYSYNVYTGNGSTTQFTIGFSYIRREHVKVYVAYVDTAYTYVNNTTVQLATAPGAGVRVEVRRVTPFTPALVDFADGSTLVAADLDTSNLQHLYLEQELDDANKQAIFVDPATGLLTAANQRITNVANPVNAQDVSTKAYTDAQIDSALINDVIAGTGLTISDNTPTAGQITVGITNSGVGATQIADGAVTSAKIADATIITGDLADGAVTSAKIADGTIAAGDLASDSVTTAKILNANVTTAKIADLNVTTGKIADLGVTTGKIADLGVTTGKIADTNITTAKIADLNVTTGKIADLNVTTGKIADLGVTTGKIADAAVTAAKIAGGSIDSTKLDGATVVTNSEHSGSTPNDTSFFTTSASDARYFRQDSSETISSGQAWSASDSYIATTAAIDARVIDLVDDVGGFVPIANENSFPVANPDINNPDGTGTIVSIAVMSTSRTPSSGTVTIANGSGSNTVTITGCGSTVLAAGFGVLVETTSTLHTYTFHRLTPKATEVTTVASISADVTTVAGNNANVTAVAGNAANITTVAGSIANVNAVGGSIANVNSVASNLASVNSFANTYRIAASDPATSLDVGDLVFNTTASELRVYNGSVWQGGVTATGNLVSRAGDTMTGALAHPLGAAATPSITFTGDTNTGIYSPGADQVAITTGGTQRLNADTAAITSTLPVVHPLGAVGTPSITFTGDLNTGIYSPGADQVAISTGGSGRLFVNNAGQVGLGVSSPQSLLHIDGDATAFRISRGSAIGFAYNTGTAATDPFRIQSNGGSVDLLSASGQPITLSAGGSEKLRVTSAGLVGIGTSGPTANFQVAHTSTTPSLSSFAGSAATFNGSSTIRLSFGTYPAPNYTSWIQSADSSGNAYSLLLQPLGGNVGIGTTSPTDTNGFGNCIDIRSSTGAAIYLRDSDDTTNDTFVIGRDNSDSYLISNSGNLLFSNNGSERARIDSSGRLLVGTSSSTSSKKLIVVGSSVNESSLWLGNNGAAPGSGNAFNALYFGNGTNGQDRAVRIEAFQDGGFADLIGLRFFTQPSDGTGPTERMRITNAGNLLVGTTTIPSPGGVASQTFLASNSSNTGSWTGTFQSTGASSNRGIVVSYSGASPNDAFNEPFFFQDSTTPRFYVKSNGGINNYSANNANLSDRNVKKNITPAANTWDCIKEWEIVNYRYKDQPDDADLNLGVIAQQVAESCPELITVFEKAKDDQPEKLGVKEQQMYWMAIKALQEAQVRIEALEAEVAALKGA